MPIRIAAVIIAIAVSSGPLSARRVDRAHPAPAGRSATAAATLGNLPVAFVENRGQTDSAVRYYARGSRYAFYLTRDAVILSFLNEAVTEGHTLALRFPGSNPAHTVEGHERASGEVNYLRGNKRKSCTLTLASSSAVTANVQ